MEAEQSLGVGDWVFGAWVLPGGVVEVGYSEVRSVGVPGVNLCRPLWGYGLRIPHELASHSACGAVEKLLAQKVAEGDKLRERLSVLEGEVEAIRAKLDGMDC